MLDKDKKVAWVKLAIVLGSLLLGAGSASAEPVKVTESVPLTAGSEASLVFPLPSEEIRAELAQQLLELALANVHPYFNEQWLALNHHQDAAAQGRQFAELFLALRQFRHQWHQLTWDARERIAIRQWRFVPTAAEFADYLSSEQQQRLADDVMALRPQTTEYLQIRKSLNALLDMARQEPWPVIPDLRLHPGESDEGLPAVKQVLVRLKLLEQADSSTLYDESLIDPIKKFQQMHGLLDDGIIGRKSVAWLRVTPEQKAVILARALLRQDVGDQLKDRRYVLVNLPEYQLRVLDGTHELMTSRVIVGQLKRQTPILSSQIASVVLNPAWHVPSTILRKDIVPKLTHDPEYLAKERIDIYDYEGTKIDPASISLDEAISAGFPYRLRQQPGDHNALGRYKFYLPNDESIYLHSTSNPRLFNKDLRAISSGCVRVEQAADLAELLLKDSNWNKDKMATVLQSKATKWVPLRTPVPVYTVYWRSWLDAQGTLQFRDDIYGFDAGKEQGSREVMHTLLPHRKA